jgi:hypothetical protein
MPGLVPGIHFLRREKTWMAGTSPAMTSTSILSRAPQNISKYSRCSQSDTSASKCSIAAFLIGWL